MIVDSRMDGWTERWMVGQKDGVVERRKGRWMNRWMSGQKDRWVD